MRAILSRPRLTRREGAGTLRAGVTPTADSSTLRTARALFGLRERVGRRTYATTGFTLAVLKYAADAGAVWLAHRQAWTPLDYLSPMFGARLERLDDRLAVALVLWTVPFLWIGASMTMRRAVDAGLSPWVALLYFVPFLNYVAMLALCAVPSRAAAGSERTTPARASRAGDVALSVAAGIAATGVVFGLSIYAFASYGTALFVGAPVLLGAVTAFVYNRRARRPLIATIGVAEVAVAVAFGAALLFALEGAICLLMIAPLAIVLAVLGAVLGHAIASLGGGAAPALVAPLALSVIAAGESEIVRPTRGVVLTAVEIDAPPEVVWRHVIEFAELPEPDWLLFRLGIAYPVRARIRGTGVGAVRTCEFSTGAFVEPITAWEPPARLAFDVASQPAPMREWSPYEAVHPPHLDRSFASRRGEFRLVALDGGRTRLEGRTWYELGVFPAAYWRPWAEWLVHRIHARVLEHIARRSESSAR
jgi:uncharacterized membrane protein YhaH (DUF805 family)